MSKNNILKEALLDAKTIRATALANAKAALEEAFSPRLEAIISEKIVSEMEDETENSFSEFEPETDPNEQPISENESQYSLNKAPKGEKTPDPQGSKVKIVSENESQYSLNKAPKGEKTPDPQGSKVKIVSENEIPIDSDEEVDADLAEVLAELEGEVADSPDEMGDGGFPTEAPTPAPVAPEAPVTEAPPVAPVTGDEEINIDEILASLEEEASAEEEASMNSSGLNEGEDEDEKDVEEKEELKEQVSKLLKENADYHKGITFLQGKLNEVNLLNAKLLYTNKLFKSANLNNAQKMKIVENMDLTKNVREVKLVYATLAESLNFGGLKNKKVISENRNTIVKTITEGLASKQITSTKPTTTSTLLTEGAEMANRFQKLAGIKVRSTK